MRSIGRVRQQLTAFEGEVMRAPEFSRYSVSRIFESLSPYGRELISLVFLVPFFQPIPIWGVSSVLGMFLMIMHGAVFVRGREAPMPRRVTEFEMPRDRLLLVLKGAQKLVSWVEKVPAWHSNLPMVQKNFRWNAAAMAFLAFFLSLPLPVPASNAVPAYGILFFLLSELSENLFLWGLAWIVFLGNIVFFSALAGLPFILGLSLL